MIRLVAKGLAFFNLFLFVLFTQTASANSVLTLDVLGEEFTLQAFPASGGQLILYVAPGYGFNQRSTSTALALSKLDIEVWMLDLAENFFIPHGNESSHSYSGRYVAEVIRQAHVKTGKNITLMSSSFGAIPVLRGARIWQINNSSEKKDYLNGAILFSPELYKTIPALGVDPEFEPITSATNIPIVIYQSELRNNRWQLENVVSQLEKSHATVYQKIMPNVVSFFYEIDELPQTMKNRRELPFEIPRILKLLQATKTPLIAPDLRNSEKRVAKNLDISLKPYKGNKSPLPIDLESSRGRRVKRDTFNDKVTVVNFWATWCPPCVEEIPMLNRLKSKMKDEKFELISINFGQEKSTIAEFLAKVNVEFPVLIDVGGKTAGDWNTVVLPSTFVIGPNGKFAYAVNAAIEWDSQEVVKALKLLARQ